MRNNPPPTIGLLFSGGVDSAVMLDWLLERGCRVVPFYVRTGCVWESCELTAVRRFLAAADHPRLSELVLLELPLGDLYGEHWSMTGRNVPDETTPDDAVFLLGRNSLLLIKPALWCHTHGIESLALATLNGNPFDDASPEFFARFEEMFRQGMGDCIEIARPFEGMTKKQIMQIGRHLPLEHTFSCLAPVGALHCGRCNKCAERQRAFSQLRLADPTRYAGAPRQPIAATVRAGKRPIS